MRAPSQQTLDEVEQPGSAQWRSSNTSTVGPRSAIRSNSVRHAAISSSRSAGRRRLKAQEGGQARLDPRPLVRVRQVLAAIAASAGRAVGRSSDSAIRARRRTISASAQNARPSP